MNSGVLVRNSCVEDIGQFKKLYLSAFPDEDLYPLVESLHAESIKPLSIVGVMNKKIVSHILFTMGSVLRCSGEVAIMGPIAVYPEHQNEGLGTALINDGLSRLKKNGLIKVYVFGAPAYYGRMGFKQELDTNPPYALPERWRAAWQSISINDEAAVVTGKLVLPKPWMEPVLWAP